MSLGRKRHVLLKPADVGSAVVRGEGNNKSEQYLAKLADRTFLNLWSYPNPFVKNEKGEGKELCDLLVVCGDDIIIFSVKEIGWQVDADEQLAWKRWYKRAILSSVDQIRGAERSISQSPDKLFVDRHCTQQLPLHLPPLERREFMASLSLSVPEMPARDTSERGLVAFLSSQKSRETLIGRAVVCCPSPWRR